MYNSKFRLSLKQRLELITVACIDLISTLLLITVIIITTTSKSFTLLNIFFHHKIYRTLIILEDLEIIVSQLMR